MLDDKVLAMLGDHEAAKRLTDEGVRPYLYKMEDWEYHG